MEFQRKVGGGTGAGGAGPSIALGAPRLGTRVSLPVAQWRAFRHMAACPSAPESPRQAGLFAQIR